MATMVTGSAREAAWICDWCGKAPGAYWLSTVYVCVACFHETLASSTPRNPQLCERCVELFTSSEYGFVLTTNRTIEFEAGISFAEYNQIRRLQTSDVLFNDKFGGEADDFPRLVVPFYLPNPGTSAETGCPLCRIFLVRDPNTDYDRFRQALDLHGLVRGGWEEVKRRYEEKGNQIVSEPLDIEGFYFESQQEFRLTLSVSALEGDPSSRHISQRPPEKYLGSVETNDQIQSWLKACLQNHTGCTRGSVDTTNLQSQLPIRVIDIGDSESSAIRIVESHDLPSWTQYVALSYCWGRDTFLTSTTKNIDSFKLQMDFSVLPQTFKDAIITVRALGFRYLWIDALCILQDSPDDKLREISRMGDIYHYASLTIASVGATKVADGFLTPKSDLAVALPYKCPDGIMGSVQVSPQPVIDLHQQTLYTRAWCMQENLLSHRILVYTDREVFWQCQTDHIKRPNTIHVSYENDNSKLRQSPFMRLDPNLFSSGLSTAQSREISSEDFYQNWTLLVQAYTRRHLSVTSDRLPAIAGIAAKFQAATANAAYYAGHWERSFIALLAWKRRKVGVTEPPIPLEQYRAPSWSWASVETPVEYAGGPEDIGNVKNLQAVFVSCSVEPISDLVPMGEVRGGTAVINASMINALVLMKKVERVERRFFHNDGRFTLEGVTLDMPSETSVKPTSHVSGVDYMTGEEWSSVWFMLLGERHEGPGRKFTRTRALILVPVDENNTFKRIGFYEVFRKSASKEWSKANDRRTIAII